MTESIAINLSFLDGLFNWMSTPLGAGLSIGTVLAAIIITVAVFEWYRS